MSESKSTTLRIVCMYCKKIMGSKEGYGVSGDSHSICQSCWEEKFPGEPYPTGNSASTHVVIDDSMFVVQKPDFIREPTVMPILRDGKKIGSIEVELPERSEIVVHEIKVDDAGTLNKGMLVEINDAIETLAVNMGHPRSGSSVELGKKPSIKQAVTVTTRIREHLIKSSSRIPSSSNASPIRLRSKWGWILGVR